VKLLSNHTEDGLAITIDPHTLEIKEFKALVTRDKGSRGDSQGRKKLQAKRDLAFVYFFCDVDSPYQHDAADARFDALKKDLEYPEDWSLEKDKVMLAAVHKYIEINRTLPERLLIAAYKGCYRLIDYFDEADFKKKDTMHRPIYSAKDMIGNLGRLAPVVENLDKLQEQVEKKRAKGANVRRDVQLNRYNT
jgi:hypothetical protein